MWLYAQPWLPLITITLAAGPSEQFYKDSRREQAETLRLRGRPERIPRSTKSWRQLHLLAHRGHVGLRPLRIEPSAPVRRDTQSDETPRCGNAPGVLLFWTQTPLSGHKNRNAPPRTAAARRLSMTIVIPEIYHDSPVTSRPRLQRTPSELGGVFDFGCARTPSAQRPFRGMALLLRSNSSAPISLMGEPGYLITHQYFASLRLSNLAGSMSGPVTIKSSLMRRSVRVVIAWRRPRLFSPPARGTVFPNPPPWNDGANIYFATETVT